MKICWPIQHFNVISLSATCFSSHELSIRHFFLQQFRNIGAYEHTVTELKKEGIRGEKRRRNCLFKCTVFLNCCKKKCLIIVHANRVVYTCQVHYTAQYYKLSMEYQDENFSDRMKLRPMFVCVIHTHIWKRLWTGNCGGLFLHILVYNIIIL